MNIAKELLDLQEKEAALSQMEMRAKVEEEAARKELISKFKIKTVDHAERKIQTMEEELEELEEQIESTIASIKESFSALLGMVK